VRFECLLEIVVRRGLDDLRQSLENLPFRVVQIAELFDVQVGKRVRSHRCLRE